MKASYILTPFLFLIGNEIISWLAILILGITFLATIMKERIEK